MGEKENKDRALWQAASILGACAALTLGFGLWWWGQSSSRDDARRAGAARARSEEASEGQATESLLPPARDSSREAIVDHASHSGAPQEPPDELASSEPPDETPPDDPELARFVSNQERFDQRAALFEQERLEGSFDEVQRDSLARQLAEHLPADGETPVSTQVECTKSICEVTLVTTESLGKILATKMAPIFPLLKDRATGDLTQGQLDDAHNLITPRDSSDERPSNEPSTSEPEGTRFLIENPSNARHSAN